MENICFDKNDQTLEIINQTQQLSSVMKIDNNLSQNENLRNNSQSSKNTANSNNFSYKNTKNSSKMTTFSNANSL